MAITMLIVAPSSARLVERFGTKRVVGSGLAIAGVGLALFAQLPAHNISYWGDVAWRMVIMALGMGLTMAPATESIMGSLPRAKAGVGSAMNDTTRQVGGAFGVAIIGSVMSSIYGSKVADVFTQNGVTGEPVAVAKDGLGQALEVAARAPEGRRGGTRQRSQRGVRVRPAPRRARRCRGRVPRRDHRVQVAAGQGGARAGPRNVHGTPGSVRAREGARRMTDAAGDIVLEARKPGRPRSVDVDRAIFEAALEEYGQHGFEVMSVDAVAARAGVSKATIYRRFESKLELVTAAMYQVAEERKPTPDTGSLAGDLRALVHNLIEMTQHQTFGCNARMMVADGLRNPELGKVHEEYVQYRRAGTLTVFERAIARGELRGDVDLQVAADVLTGPVFYRHLVSHMPIDDAYGEQVIAAFLRAYGA